MPSRLRREGFLLAFVNPDSRLKSPIFARLLVSINRKSYIVNRNFSR